jgi:hypothetical protein
MKTKRRSSSRGRRTVSVRVALPLGMRKTRVVSKSRVRRPRASNVFTPMETGRPDADRLPGVLNPAAAQSGVGPLNQEGEGEKQNDDLAALEGIEPNL